MVKRVRDQVCVARILRKFLNPIPKIVFLEIFNEQRVKSYLKKKYFPQDFNNCNKVNPSQISVIAKHGRKIGSKVHDGKIGSKVHAKRLQDQILLSGFRWQSQKLFICLCCVHTKICNALPVCVRGWEGGKHGCYNSPRFAQGSLVKS
jgi:hypothetical protein